jgi:hypothetical protein
MTQTDLNRAVASATGESIRTIASRGFSLIEAPPHDPELSRDPLIIDWDELEALRWTAA